MPKFFNNKDLTFIKTISEEVVDYVTEQSITLFKMSVGESKTNLYGESLGKIYHMPTNLMCIVDREPQNVIYEGFGPDKTQLVEFRFMRHRLRTHQIPQLHDINGVQIPAGAIQNSIYGYPQIGDIIKFDSAYYEINHTREHKLVGGSPTIYDEKTNSFQDARMELIVAGFMVRRSQIQIEDRIY